MAILRNKTQSNYTIISQCITTDKNLGCMERGVLLTILSLPDNWNFTIEGLCAILPYSFFHRIILYMDSKCI